MNKLVLIDGNALLYRAYHALPPTLTSKDGVVINAVYGFFSMFFKIIEQAAPQYIVVCFDRPKPTFRHTMYVGYHANRPKMADDLVPQIGIVHEILAKIGVTIFEVDGYEADDLIGTLATQAVTKTIDDRRWRVVVEGRNSKIEKNKIHPQSSNFKNPSSTVQHPSSTLEVIIVSGDRDLLQLVNGHVKLLMPITGITNMSLFDEKAVEAKYGVHPKQFIDYKALIGDASDNYPGVDGIGPKTASSLLQKYGTFENLYTHIPELSERIGTQLATDAEQAAMAKKLATIVTDAPITLDLAKTDCCHIDADSIRESFEKLGFKSLQNRIPKQIIENSKIKMGNQLGLL